MRTMRRLAVLMPFVALLVAAPAALAHDGGQGWWGDVSDKTTTNAGFIVIIFFPLFILFASLLLGHLEKRKARRKAAEKDLAGDWRGGW
jgi:hypothetical protein